MEGRNSLALLDLRKSPDHEVCIFPRPFAAVATAPLRVSLVGGGTDLPSHFDQAYGATLSGAIDRSATVALLRPARAGVTVHWGETSWAAQADQIANPVIREALKLANVTEPLEILISLDVPTGTGLGSSSAIAVALLAALHAAAANSPDTANLARSACELELDRLRAPIGLQDQYISAFGGLRHMSYHPGRRVVVGPDLLDARRAAECEAHLTLFYTGGARSANAILVAQNERARENASALSLMARYADDLAAHLRSTDRVDWELVARLVNENWRLKRDLAPGVNTSEVDGLLAAAQEAGAMGAKLLGAGGAGFILVIAAPERRAAVARRFDGLPSLPVRFTNKGGTVSTFIHGPA